MEIKCSTPLPGHFPNFYLETMDCSRRLIIYSFLLESVEYIYISFENVIYKVFLALLKLNRDIFLERNGSESKFTISSRISINKPSLETKSNKLKVIANSSSNPCTSPPTSFETGARTWLHRFTLVSSSPRLRVVVNHVSRTISSPFVGHWTMARCRLILGYVHGALRARPICSKNANTTRLRTGCS